MANNSNTPRPDDVVLGGQNVASIGALVLGGIEGPELWGEGNCNIVPSNVGKEQ